MPSKEVDNPDDDSNVCAETIPNLALKGFDSLTVLEVLTDFDKHTGLYFEDEVFYDCKTGEMQQVKAIAGVMFAQLLSKGAKNVKN